MRINLDTFEEVRRPMYIAEEAKLRRNLELIASVATRAEVEIILAFKAFALWKTFPIFKEYIRSTTASSLSEAKLAFEEFGSRAHTYSPAYTDDEIGEIASCSSHLMSVMPRSQKQVMQVFLLACGSTLSTRRLRRSCIIPVPQVRDLGCRQNDCPTSCRRTSRDFIVIAIARVVPTCLLEP